MKFFALTAGLTFAQDNIEVTTAAPSVNEVRVWLIIMSHYAESFWRDKFYFKREARNFVLKVSFFF